MWNKIIIATLMALTLNFGAVAADRLAVAEPVGKGGVSATEIEAIWGMLESSVGGDYELISRSVLQQMMTEIGLTVSSDLVNLDSAQKAKMGELKTVKYILTSNIGKFGTRYNISLMVVDASTGGIDPNKTTSETVNSFDELADKLKDMLKEMGIGREAKKSGMSALLAPEIKVANTPAYLSEDFNVGLENVLLTNKVRLHNLQSVSKILTQNKISNLYEVEPAMFVRIGELLRVDFLIQASINRYSIDTRKEYIKASKRTVERHLGNIDGSIRIISAKTGEVIGSIPFRQRVDFDDIDDTNDWVAADYGKFLIEKGLSQVIPKVLSALK